jgi:hypothetical protein
MSTENEGWQPVRIAPKEKVAPYHNPDPGNVSKWGRASALGGEIIRVRLSEDAKFYLAKEHSEVLGCSPERFVEVHPDDAHRLWPECDGSFVGLCEHQIEAD